MVKVIGNTVLGLFAAGLISTLILADRQKDVMGQDYYVLFFSNMIFFLIGLYMFAIVKSESSVLLSYPNNYLVFAKTRYELFLMELRVILLNPFILSLLFSYYGLICFTLTEEFALVSAIKYFIILFAQYIFFVWTLLLVKDLTKENSTSFLLLIAISTNTLAVVGNNMKLFYLQFNPFEGWLFIFNYLYLINGAISIIAILATMSLIFYFMHRISRRLLSWHV
jgi:hypothetical protein